MQSIASRTLRRATTNVSKIQKTAALRCKLAVMAIRQAQLSSEADPIPDSVAESYGGDTGLALSELLLAHQSIESFPDELEAGLTTPWEQIKLENGL